MIFVIRQLRGSENNQTLVDRKLDGSVLSIGRGADRDVLINDSRVAWEHAEVRIEKNDRFSLYVDEDAGSVLLNGAPSRGGRLADGDTVGIGGTDITFRILEDRIYIEIREVRRGKDDAADQLRAQSRLSLSEARVSKRRWSWALFVLVLGLGALLPLAGRYLPSAMTAALPSALQHDIWISGPISSAHQNIGSQCELCHLQPFEMAPDRACAGCHQNLAHHADDADVMQELGLDSQRCASCHHEHEGDAGLIQDHPRLCTACHASPEQKLPGSDLLAAADFADDHPEFSPQTWQFNAEDEREDVSTPLQGRLLEESSLIFPHDLHLDPEGIEDRRGDLQTLSCDSCHAYQAGEVRFQPVQFGPHCQDCHSLEFDPANPGREVPHGNTQAVLEDLRGYFARAVLEGREYVPLVAPGGPRGRGRSTGVNRKRGTLLEKADAFARDAIDESLRVRLCAKCHRVDVSTSSEAEWDDVPFQQRDVWMTAARFDHSAHQVMECGACHQAATSESADDVLMPARAACTGCHGGSHTGADRIPSTCVDCHGFHIAESLLMPATNKDASLTTADAEVSGSGGAAGSVNAAESPVR